MLAQHKEGLSYRLIGRNLGLSKNTVMDDASRPGSRQTRLVALELGETGHDGAHELASSSAEIEAEAGLRRDVDLPTVEIIERLHEVLSAATPAREFGYENGIDLACLRHAHRGSAFPVLCRAVMDMGKHEEIRARKYQSGIEDAGLFQEAHQHRAQSVLGHR